MPPKSTRDATYLLRAFQRASEMADLKTLSLGDVDSFPLLFALPKKARKGPHLLIAAGFHGEESAGCWGLLHFVRSHQALLQQANVSFLPLVNPTGLARGQRVNFWDENPNRGFGKDRDDDGTLVKPSLEGRLLLASLERLTEAARDGFLSLHEDADRKNFFLYTFEQKEDPGPFSRILTSVGTSFFPLTQDESISGDEVEDGIIFNLDDGSFESHLFYRQGIPRAACTETPGRRPFRERLLANVALAKAFVALHL